MVATRTRGGPAGPALAAATPTHASAHAVADCDRPHAKSVRPQTSRGARPPPRARGELALSSRPNGSSFTFPFSKRQVPVTRPSTRKVAIDCGVFVLKTFERCSSGRICARRAWSQQASRPTPAAAVPGAGVSASGSGNRGRSMSSAPSSARKRRSSRSASAALTAPIGRPAQSAVSCRRRRSEGAQVARDQSRRGVALRRCGVGADPLARQRELVGSAAVPGTRRRYADQVEPGIDRADPRRPLADQLLQLPAGDHAIADTGFDGARDSRQLGGRRKALARAQPLLAAALAGRRRPRPPVARGDEMDRCPQQRPLDNRAPLERPRQRIAVEVLKPRPQSDVHRRRVLGLDAADALERLRNRELARWSNSWRARTARLSSRSLRVRSQVGHAVRLKARPEVAVGDLDQVVGGIGEVQGAVAAIPVGARG